MRHNTLKNRFGRTTSHREAMMRNMVTNLFKWEKMETTISKAKEVKRHAEKIITKAKRITPSRLEKAKGDEKVKLTAQRLHAIRLAGETVQDKEVLKKLFDELGPRYETRNGGYTRLLRKGFRLGDGTEVGILELVDRPDKSDEKKADKAEKKDKKPRSENRPKKQAAPPKRHGGGPQGGGPVKPQGPKGGGGFDASRGRGGSRGS
jgi:large subunit ribosomal protein L17